MRNKNHLKWVIAITVIIAITLVFLFWLRGGNGSGDNTNDSSYVIATPDGFPNDYLRPCMEINSESFRPGRGLKTGTYDVVQCAIDTNSLAWNTVVAPNSGETFVDYDVIEDFSSLKSFIGLNISLNANIGWFKMESSLNKLESYFRNSFSTCLVAKVTVTNALKTMEAPRLFQRTQELLLNNPNEFYKNYGDRFINGIRTGGELYIVYEFFANSSEEKRQITAHLDAKASGLTTSLQAVMDYTQSLETQNRSKKMSVHIYRKGDKSNLPDNDISQIIAYVNSFPSKVTSEAGAFISYTTIPYTEVGWTVPLVDRQKTLDSLAYLQRKVYQLLSWKQEKIKETLKNIDFALDTTLWNLTSSQTNAMTNERQKLKGLDERLNSCYNTCLDITQCEDCKNIIYEPISYPQYDSYKSTEKFDYRRLFIPIEVTHIEKLLCRLEPNQKYKLVFDGNLLAPGNIPFDAFVSSQNDDRAFTFSSLGTDIKAYPVVCIRMYGMGNNEGVMVPININQKTWEIETKNSPVTITGVNRYYRPNQGIWKQDTPIYLTPSPGWTWPTLEVYRWEKL